MLRINFLKEKLASGKTVLGTWCVIPSSVVADVIANSGVDFLIIDSEHGPVNFETAQDIIMACESREVSAGVRISGLCESEILKALDIGAHFLHIPNIMTEDEARKAVQFVKYPPLGRRGFSPFTRAGGYSALHAKELTTLANQSVLLGIHIEGKEAIDNLEQILKIKELDIVFLGLYDISKSLGMAGQIDHPEVITLLKEMTQTINASSKYSGTIVTNAEQLKRALDFGVRYITYSVDCEVITSSYRQIYAQFKKLSVDHK